MSVRVLLSVVAVAGLLSMVLDPVPARAGTATIPWGNVACDPPSAQLPDPAKRRGVLFLNVGGIQGETKERLSAACERGDSSLYITGINPGWINTMVTAMTAICRDVQMVSIFESADVTVYESAETWQALGFSLPEAPPAVIEMAKMWLSTFYDSVQRMGVALGYVLDDMEFFIDHATASEKVDLGWLCIEKDTIAAIRAGWNGKVNGKTVLQSNVAWSVCWRAGAVRLAPSSRCTASSSRSVI